MSSYTDSLPHHRHPYSSLIATDRYRSPLYNNQKSSDGFGSITYKALNCCNGMPPVKTDSSNLDDAPPPPLRLVRQDSSANECYHPGVTVTSTFLDTELLHSYPEKRSYLASNG